MTARPSGIPPLLGQSPKCMRRSDLDRYDALSGVVLRGLQPAPTMKTPSVTLPAPPSTARAPRKARVRHPAPQQPASPLAITAPPAEASSSRRRSLPLQVTLYGSASGIMSEQSTALSRGDMDGVDPLLSGHPDADEPVESVTEKLAELAKAMHKFQTVADIALLNMGARQDSRDSDEGRKWIAMQDIRNNVSDVVEILQDVSARNAVALRFMKAVTSDPESRTLALMPVDPAAGVRRGGGANFSADASLTFKSQRSTKRGVNVTSGSPTASFLRQQSMMGTDFDADGTMASALEDAASGPATNAAFVTSDSIDLHRSLLELLSLCSPTQERTLRRSDSYTTLPPFFETLRRATATAMLDLQTMSETMHELRRQLAIAEKRLMDAEESDVQPAPPNFTAETDQTVVVCELHDLRRVVASLSPEDAAASRELVETLAIRTASAAGGRVVASHDEALAAAFPSPLDALAWARGMQVYVLALPWPEDLLDVPACAAETRGVLARRELAALRASTSAKAASSKLAHRVRSVSDAFVSTIASLPATRAALLREPIVAVTPEDFASSTTNASNAGAAIEELVTRYSRRGLKLRIGVHHIAMRDLRLVQEAPVNLGCYTAAVVATLGRPGQTLVSPPVISAANAICSAAGGALQVLGAQATEIASLHPYDGCLEQCGVHNALRLDWDCLPPATAASHGSAVSLFEPLDWLIRPLVPVHQVAHLERRFVGGVTKTRSVGVNADIKEDPLVASRSTKRRLAPGIAAAATLMMASSKKTSFGKSQRDNSPSSHGSNAGASPVPTLDPPLIVTQSKRSGKGKKRGSQASNLQTGSQTGSPKINHAAAQFESLLSIQPVDFESDEEDVITADAACQAGDEIVSLGSIDAKSSTLGFDTVRLLGAILSRAEGLSSGTELVDAMAAFVGHDGKPEPQLPAGGTGGGRRSIASNAANLKSQVFAPPAWSVAWSRLEKRLLAYLPTTINRHASPIADETVCRDAVCAALSLVDDSLQLLRTTHGKKRYGDALGLDLVQMYSERAIVVRAYLSRSRMEPSFARSLTANFGHSRRQSRGTTGGTTPSGRDNTAAASLSAVEESLSVTPVLTPLVV
jgi:hypothetical protein